MIRAARATLALHRVEVLIGIGIALVAAAWAGWVELQAAGVRPSAECFEAWVSSGGLDEPKPCYEEMVAWYRVVVGAGDFFRNYTEFLPFIAGALVGAPIVARELEARTAAMAWSMSPSRTRWLARQVVPIALVVGLAIALAGLAASLIIDDEAAFGAAFGGGKEHPRIGTYGVGLVARAIGVLGLGVFVGTLFARQLPSFLLTVMLGLGFVNVMTPVRDAWLASHEAHLLGSVGPSGEFQYFKPGSVSTTWGWIGADGVLLSKEAAAALAPPELVALDEGQVQPVHVATWLSERGYVEVPLGISQEVAFGWAFYEAGAYVLLGLGSIAVAAWLVNRRRPA